MSYVPPIPLHRPPDRLALPCPSLFRKIPTGPSALHHPFQHLKHLPYAINAYGLVRWVPDTPQHPWPTNLGDPHALRDHLAAYLARLPWSTERHHLATLPHIIRTPQRPCAPLDPLELAKLFTPLPPLRDCPPVCTLLLPPLPHLPIDPTVCPPSLRGAGLRYVIHPNLDHPSTLPHHLRPKIVYPFPLADAYLGPFPYAPLSAHTRDAHETRTNFAAQAIPRLRLIQLNKAAPSFCEPTGSFRSPIYQPQALPAAWPEFFPLFADPRMAQELKLVRQPHATSTPAQRHSSTVCDWGVALRTHKRLTKPPTAPNAAPPPTTPQREAVERVNGTPARRIMAATIAYEFAPNMTPNALHTLLGWPASTPAPSRESFSKSLAVRLARTAITAHRYDKAALGLRERPYERSIDQLVRDAYAPLITIHRLRLLGIPIPQIAQRTNTPLNRTRDILSGRYARFIHPALSPECYPRAATILR